MKSEAPINRKRFNSQIEQAQDNDFFDSQLSSFEKVSGQGGALNLSDFMVEEHNFFNGRWSQPQIEALGSKEESISIEATKVQQKFSDCQQ